MPLLAGWFLTIFTNIAGFFLKFLSRRFAIVASVTAVIIGMTAALALLLKGMLAEPVPWGSKRQPFPRW